MYVLSFKISIYFIVLHKAVIIQMYPTLTAGTPIYSTILPLTLQSVPSIPLDSIPLYVYKILCICKI